MGQVLAAAGKYFHAQFIFQQPDLLADPGLGRIEALSGRGNVQLVVGNFPDVPELL
jgi:hypothetical protein